jgi:hypothetical protein
MRAMQADVGMEVYLHTFFNFGTIRRWVESFMLRPLYRLGNSDLYPLTGRSPTECGVPECDPGTSVMRRRRLTRVCCAMENKKQSTCS